MKRCGTKRRSPHRPPKIIQSSISASAPRLETAYIVELLYRAGENGRYGAVLVDGPCSLHRLCVSAATTRCRFRLGLLSGQRLPIRVFGGNRLFVCLPATHRLLTCDELRWSDLNRAKRVGPRPQMGDRPQILERVPLLLQDVAFGIGQAVNDDRFGLNFGRLPLAATALTSPSTVTEQPAPRCLIWLS